ncbi:MAG: hypothetical protein KF708_00365 [Pirellulales bacterium]|nr:hypothetical protein [Pirellulales bacterium]
MSLRSLSRLPVVCMLLLAVVALEAGTRSQIATAADDATAAKEPIEGQLWNLADKPFTFKLRRRDGVAWSAPITVEPGKYYSLRTDGQEASGLEGITGKGTGHVSIEYAELGGKIRLQLPAQDKADNLVPYWYHVKDSNGFSRLVQAKTVEDAEKQQAAMQQEPKLSPQEVTQIRKMLKANWVFFD